MPNTKQDLTAAIRAASARASSALDRTIDRAAIVRAIARARAALAYASDRAAPHVPADAADAIAIARAAVGEAWALLDPQPRSTP